MAKPFDGLVLLAASPPARLELARAVAANRYVLALPAAVLPAGDNRFVLCCCCAPEAALTNAVRADVSSGEGNRGTALNGRAGGEAVKLPVGLTCDWISCKICAMCAGGFGGLLMASAGAARLECSASCVLVLDASLARAAPHFANVTKNVNALFVMHPR